jgi:hypothetical protein
VRSANVERCRFLNLFWHAATGGPARTLVDVPVPLMAAQDSRQPPSPSRFRGGRHRPSRARARPLLLWQTRHPGSFELSWLTERTSTVTGDIDWGLVPTCLSEELPLLHPSLWRSVNSLAFGWKARAERGRARHRVSPATDRELSRKFRVEWGRMRYLPAVDSTLLAAEPLAWSCCPARG